MILTILDTIAVEEVLHVQTNIIYMLILKQTFVGALMNVAPNMIENWKRKRIIKSSTYMYDRASTTN